MSVIAKPGGGGAISLGSYGVFCGVIPQAAQHIRGILILWIKFYRYGCVVPQRHRLMVGSFVRVMNFVDPGVKGGRILMPIRIAAQNVRENAPRRKGMFE